ncbi:MAG: peptidylprolyl isomerase [Cyclobacteriaceae bacterium]|nr:peptidylprolyl isomerase [Cyclobacteriaceae bacterium]
MKKIIILALFTLMFAGCDRDTDFLITISTPYGDMKAILYDETPLHKENFIKLAREGQYDSTIFHRIIKEFMVQGGDINQKPNNTQSIDYTVPAEFVPKYYHKKGAIAAARQGDQINPQKASSGCQFYVVQGKIWDETELTTDMNKLNAEVGRLIRMPGYDSIGEALISAYRNKEFKKYEQMMYSLVPDVEKKLGSDVKRPINKERIATYTTEGGSAWLDDQYTVFGQVVEGLEVIDKLAAVETGQQDRPLEDIMMTVTVEEVLKKKLTDKYGIVYPETTK